MHTSIPPRWTGDIVKDMHLNGITGRDLAAVLGDTPDWISKILNGKKTPRNAETRLRTALDILITQKGKSPP